MATYNLGMLTAGMPDPTLRQVSSGIQDLGYLAGQNDAWQADWQKRYDAAKPVARYSDGNVFGTLAGMGYNPGQAEIPYEAIVQAQQNTPSSFGGWDDSARQALNDEKAKQDATFAMQTAGMLANQQAQQQAYNQSGGGTFLGGNINASYATPNTGLDPNSSLNGMLTQQPWSMPGFGGPTGGASQSGFGTNTGNAWGGSQPSGWGGPFTAKNPWAAS